MSFIIAGTTLAVGAVTLNEAGKQADAANATNAQANSISQQNIDFAQEQYEDWKEIYGPVEQNLSSFFLNLTPEYIESQGLQKQQKAFQEQRTQLNEFFAKNNIESGVQTDIFAKTVLQNEREKAQIRADAPFKVAEQQSSFLSLGLPGKTNTASSINNARTNFAGSLRSQANTEAAGASAGFQAGTSLLQSGVEEIVKANQGKPGIE